MKGPACKHRSGSHWIPSVPLLRSLYRHCPNEAERPIIIRQTYNLFDFVFVIAEDKGARFIILSVGLTNTRNVSDLSFSSVKYYLRQLLTKASEGSNPQFYLSLCYAAIKCKTFSGKPGSRRHLGSVNTKIGMHRSKMAAIDCDSQYDTCIKLGF